MSQKFETLKIGNICPKCNSTQFSVLQLPLSALDLFPPEVIGLGECKTCQQDFFVCLAPELYNVISMLFEGSKIQREVLSKLFPQIVEVVPS